MSILIHPQAIEQPFNKLAFTSGLSMGAHDRDLRKPCNADNWPDQNNTDQVRRACFENGYYQGYKING